MKYIFIVFLLLVVAIRSNGQAICPPNGISTNPSNAYNNQFPSKINTFDWLAPTYRFNYKNGAIPIILPSPFYDPTPNAGFASTLVTIKDMKPADGWELISREFGYENDNITKKILNIQYPMLVLYNRYTGLLRFFTSIKASDRNADYTSASFTMFMNGFSTSALLPLSTSVLDFTPPLVIAQTTFSNGDFQWFFADFQINYDPCTCNQDSKIKVEVNLVKTSKITLSGSLTGTLTSVDNGVTTADDKNSKWSFSKDNLINSIEKGKQTYESIEAFKKQEFGKLEGAYKKTTSSIANQLLNVVGLQLAAKKDDTKQKLDFFTKLLSKSSFLREGLKAAPVIGAGVSFLTSFVAGGNESAPDPQKVEIMPMAINAEIKLSGTITDEILRNTYTISTPGSKYNPLLPEEWYPYYNETLGVLNILEKPDVNLTVRTSAYGRNPDFCRIENYYQLNRQLDFVVNPAAGFKSNPEVQVAYVFEYGDANDVNINILNGIVEKRYASYLEVEGIASLRTPYIPIRLLPDYIAVADLNSSIYFPTQSGLCGQVNPPTKVYLKFLVNLERKDATAKTQNVLYVVKYEVNLVNYTTTKSFLYPMSATAGPYFSNRPWIPITYGGTFRYYDKITIQQKIIPLASNILKMQSGEIIVEIPQNTALGDVVLDSSLGGEVILESMGSLQTASQTRVVNFCNDARYKDDVSRQSKTVAPTKTEAQAEVPKSLPQSTQLLSAFPNPTTGETTIRYEVQKEGSSIEIFVSSMLGERVITLANVPTQGAGVYEVHFDASKLAEGIYIYTLLVNGERISKKLVVSK